MIILEKLGVPKNIEDTSKKITNLLLKKIQEEGNTEIDANSNYEYELKTISNISDYKVNKINISLSFIVSDSIKEIDIYGMSFSYDSEIDPKSLKLINKKSPIILLKIIFGLPEKPDSTFNELLEFYVKSIDKIQSSFSHELHHAYENFKKDFETPHKMSKYRGYTSVNFNLKPINNFIHYLYFTTATENLVKPSEVNSLMKKQGVKKENFVDFILNENNYIKYKKISNFTLDEMKKQLLNYIPEINEILKGLDEDHLFNTDDEKINRLLELIYVNLSNNIIEGFETLITSSFFETLIGFEGEKEIVFTNFVRNMQRYSNNPIKYFEYEIRKMNNISNKMLKKLSKLYGLINNKKSIKNWDIHDKITKKTQIESHYKY